MKSKIVVALLAAAFVLSSGMVLMPEVKAQGQTANLYMYGNYNAVEGTASIPGDILGVDALILQPSQEIKPEEPTATEDNYADITGSSPGRTTAGAGTSLIVGDYWSPVLQSDISITGTMETKFWVTTEVAIINLAFDISLGKNGVRDDDSPTMSAVVGDVMAGDLIEVVATGQYDGVEYAEGDIFGIYIYASVDATTPGEQGQNSRILYGSIDHPGHISMPGVSITAFGGTLPVSDISLSTEEETKTVSPGNSVIHTIELNNAGDTDETLTMSTSNVPDGWTAELGDSSVDVAAGDSKTTTLKVTAPATASDGDQAIIDVIASNENVMASVRTEAIVSADAVTYGVELTASPTAGEADKEKTAEYTVTVKNTGSAEDTISFAASSENGWNVAVSKADVTLAAGASETVTLSVTVPAAAIEGTVDTTTLTASAGDGSTYTADVETSVVSGAGGDSGGSGGIPGFEVVALLGAIGVALLLRRRR